MSSLYFRGRSIWISYTDNGRRRNKSTGITVDHVQHRNGRPVFPPEARELKRKIDNALALGRFGLREQKRPRATLSELLALHLNDKGPTVSKATAYEYRRAIERLVDAVGDISATALTEEHVAAFRNKLLGELRKNSTAKILRHLHAVLAFGVRRGILERNVMADYRLKPEPVEKATFTQKELTAFFAHTKTKAPDVFRQCLFLLLTGFRSNDSCRFRWDMIGEGAIRYVNQKANVEELMPKDAALDALFRSCPGDYAPFVFRYRTIWQLYDHFARARDAAGLRKELTVHSLKRAYANALYDSAGDDLFAVQKLAHHSTIAVTQAAYIARRREAQLRRVLESSRREIAPVIESLSE